MQNSDGSDKSVNQFINEMADAGFEFVFKAKKGDVTYIGACVMQDDNKCEVTFMKAKTPQEAITLIRKMLDDDKNRNRQDVSTMPKRIGGSYKGK